jgi:TolA-binding protein
MEPTARRRPALAASAVLFALAPLGGCFFATTKHEGQELRRDVDALERKVDQGLGGKVEQLEKVLDDATKLLTRNSADLGAEVSNLGDEQRKLNGLVMEAKRLADEIGPLVEKHEVRLGELEQRVAALEQKTTVAPPKSAAELWNEGQAALAGGDSVRAEAAFRTLVVKYPSDDRADDAQLGRAESLARARQFDKALPEFQKVYDKYPTSSVADQALFRAGEVALELRWCTDARAYFGLLRQKYPRSSLAKKARDKDAAIKKIAGDKKKCQS